MARKSLRPQLNQIRAWVRQGRTEAWIAHQLEVSSSQLRDFIKRNGLEEGDEPANDADLRDEIEAEIEAELDEEPEEDEEDDEDEEPEVERRAARIAATAKRDRPTRAPARTVTASPAAGVAAGAGGRGRGRGRKRDLEAAFDHGEKDGYGLWLDPSVKDDPVYAEHWAGERKLKVTFEEDKIVLERAGSKDD